MDTKHQEQQRRARLVSFAILIFGCCSAVVVYLTAREPEENPLIDQLENSKIYRRSLELYGGKANLLAEQFSRWFATLWHGKMLAFTILIISAVVAGLYYFFAAPLPPEEK